MKKKYEKPMILMETYELSQSIAGNCSVVLNNNSITSCTGHPNTSWSDNPNNNYDDWLADSYEFLYGIDIDGPAIPFNDNACTIIEINGTKTPVLPPNDDYCYHNGAVPSGLILITS